MTTIKCESLFVHEVSRKIVEVIISILLIQWDNVCE